MIKFVIVAALMCWLIYHAARILPNWIISKETIEKIDQIISNMKANMFALCIVVLAAGAGMVVYGLTR